MKGVLPVSVSIRYNGFMALLEPRMRTLFVTLFGVFTLYGTSMTIVGATLPRILKDFHWDYLTAGAVIAAGAITYFLSTFASGWLVKHWGAKATTLVGLTLAVVGLTFFGAVSDPLTNLLLNALIGLGQGAFEVSVNWATIRIDTAKTGRPMNVMHGAFAIGAIAGPFVLGLLMGAGGDWTLLYRGMAGVFAVLALVLVAVPMKLAAEPEGEVVAAEVRLSRQPAYWLSFLVLFLYVGVELGVSNWIAEYFVQVFGFTVASSSFLVSLFWGGVLAGRFGVPVFLRRMHPDRQLLWFSGLAMVATLGLPALGLVADLGFAPLAGAALVFVAGLGCSIVYPAIMTLVGQCFPRDQSRVVGFAATGGGVGAFVFPFLMSALSQAWGIRWGFVTYGVFAILMTLAAVGLAAAAAKNPARQP